MVREHILADLVEVLESIRLLELRLAGPLRVRLWPRHVGSAHEVPRPGRIRHAIGAERTAGMQVSGRTAAAAHGRRR